MHRASRVVGRHFIPFAGLLFALAHAAQAQSTKTPARLDPADDVLMRRIGDRDVVDFRHSGTIEELLNRVASVWGIPLIIDWAEFGAMGIRKTDRTGDLHLFSTNARGVLREALLELGQGEVRTYVWVEGGQLHICGPDCGLLPMLFGEFDVSILLGEAGSGSHDFHPNGLAATVENVTDAVSEFTVFESWLVNGGKGTAEVAGSTLFVNVEREAMRRVGPLLTALQSPAPPEREIARIAPYFLHDDLKQSRRVADRLAMTINAPAFDAVPFGQAVDWFIRELGVPTHIEWFALDTRDVNRRTRFSLPAMPGVAAFAWLECALQQVLEGESRIGFTVRDGIFSVSTLESLGNRPPCTLMIGAERLARLLGRPEFSGESPDWERRFVRMEMLVDMLTVHASFDSWMVNGGKGSAGVFADRILMSNSDSVVAELQAALAKMAAAHRASSRGEFAVLRDWDDDPKQKWNARVIERLGQRAFPNVHGEMSLRRALAELSTEAGIAIWPNFWDEWLREGPGRRESLLDCPVRVLPEVLTYRARLDATLRQVPRFGEHAELHVRGGIVFVSCEDGAYSRICRAYPIARVLRAVKDRPECFDPRPSGNSADGTSDRVDDPNDPGSAFHDRLMDWLMAISGPNRWQVNGGPSEISMYGDMLMVTADAYAHDTIEAALRAAQEKAR